MFDRKKAVTIEPAQSPKGGNANNKDQDSSSYTLLQVTESTDVIVGKKATMPDDTIGEGVVLIGKGTRLVGEINNCTTVQIQGQFEGNIVADEIVISEGGSLNGYAKTDRALVHGNLEGNVVVANLLDISSTGRVSGELTYGQLAVAAGGHVGGTVQRVGSDIESSAPPVSSLMKS